MSNKYPLVEVETGGCLLSENAASEVAAGSAPIMRMGLESDRPDKISISKWMPMENQGRQGACAGHSLSTNAEYLYYLQTGHHIQLSRACGYYETQRIDGIRGDRGSTIQGGVKLLTRDGICTEANWPYPSGYNNRRPAGYESMPKFKCTSYVHCKTYEDVYDHLSSKAGAIHIGIGWSGIDQQVARDGVVRQYRPGPGSGAGHSVALAGYSKEMAEELRIDPDKPPIELLNSWSESWGNRGRCWVLPEAIDQMLRHRYTVFAGLTGAVIPDEMKPEQVEF